MGRARRAVPAAPALAVVALVAIGCGAGSDVAPTPRDAADATPARTGTTPGAVRIPPLRPGRFSALLKRPAQVRATPGGRVLGRVGTRTKFGTRTALAVLHKRDGWLGVLNEITPNRKVGWIPEASATLQRQPYTLRIDLSERFLVVKRGANEIRGFRVAIGAPGTRTPTGRAAVTDMLVFPTGSGPYGCCAAALTSRQTSLPSTWTGGAQIAVHGTPDESVIGQAVSLGCVRARNTDMRWLTRNVPPGALVTIVR